MTRVHLCQKKRGTDLCKAGATIHTNQTIRPRNSLQYDFVVRHRSGQRWNHCSISVILEHRGQYYSVLFLSSQQHSFNQVMIRTRRRQLKVKDLWQPGWSLPNTIYRTVRAQGRGFSAVMSHKLKPLGGTPNTSMHWLLCMAMAASHFSMAESGTHVRNEGRIYAVK